MYPEEYEPVPLWKIALWIALIAVAVVGVALYEGRSHLEERIIITGDIMQVFNETDVGRMEVYDFYLPDRDDDDIVGLPVLIGQEIAISISDDRVILSSYPRQPVTLDCLVEARIEGLVASEIGMTFSDCRLASPIMNPWPTPTPFKE